MLNANIAEFFHRIDHLDTRFCILFNTSSQRAYIRYFFRGASRLGDGVFWYTLILFLPYVNGDAGWPQSLHVAITGLCALILYKFLKHRLVRERPFINCAVIQQAAPALDRYSFPSGHTLHAVCFSVLLGYYLPQLAVLVWGFTALVAMSRVILGLHYPTDVLAGAALGALLAFSSLSLIVM